MTANITLDRLQLLESAYITSLDIDGSLRRRLLDLGFAAGSFITPLFVSPLGDPTAYSIMGSVIALRGDIASKIHITAPDSAVETEAHKP